MMCCEEKAAKRMGKNESPDSIIRHEIWEIWLQRRDGVLSRDIGTQVTIPHCDWNTARVPRRPACLVVMFPKSSVTVSFAQCHLMHNS